MCGRYLDTWTGIRRESRSTQTGKKPQNHLQIMLMKTAHPCQDFEVGQQDRWFGMVEGRAFWRPWPEMGWRTSAIVGSHLTWRRSGMPRDRCPCVCPTGFCIGSTTSGFRERHGCNQQIFMIGDANLFSYECSGLAFKTEKLKRSLLPNALRGITHFKTYHQILGTDAKHEAIITVRVQYTGNPRQIWLRQVWRHT